MERADDDPRWGDRARDRKAQAIAGTLRRALVTLPRGTWIDVGCGSGQLAAELARIVQPAKMIGVDPEPWQRWSSLMAADPRLSLVRGGCEELPALVGAGSVDVAVCNQVYEHVPDPVGLLGAIRKVLKPDGACYFAGPNLLWPIEPHVFWPFVHWLPRPLARRAMRSLGSGQSEALDAYSTHWLRLRRWFGAAGFDARLLLRERVAEELRLRGATSLARLAARMPDALYPEAMSPGFVYLLVPKGRAAS